MLLKFGLHNFKAFRDQSFDLAPITVFVGRNGTGKSSALQALAFLKQSSLAGEAVYTGREGAPVLADLSSFTEVVHGGDTALSVGITMHARMDSLGPTPWPVSGKEFLGRLPIEFAYRCDLGQTNKQEEMISASPSGGLAMTVPSVVDIDYAEREFSLAIARPFQGFYAYENRDQSIAERPILSSSIYATSPYVTSPIVDIVEDVNKIGKALPIQLKRFFYVSAGRGFVGQTFPLRDDTHIDLTTTAGYSDFSSNAATALAKNRRMEEQVSDWLESVTRLRIRSELVQIGERWGVSIVFLPPRGGNGRMSVGANNESFGANQLSQALLQIALAANDPMVGNEATIGIEEPEVHLHPRAQRNFVEMLAAIAKKGTQFIISTHSERIVSRLLVLVAKGVLPLEDVAVYAFDKDEQGVATAEKLEMDEMGRVTGGIPGFFEESVEDMSEIMAALKKRA